MEPRKIEQVLKDLTKRDRPLLKKKVMVQSGLRWILGRTNTHLRITQKKMQLLYGNQRLYHAQKEKEKLYMEGNFEDDEVNNRLGELEIICAEEDPTYESEGLTN